MIGVPEGAPRVVDVYIGREKLVDMPDSERADRDAKRLSWILVADSGTGMNNFSAIATRGQVPKRLNAQVR